MLTLRPGVWRLGVVVTYGALLAVFVAFAVIKLAVGQPGQAIISLIIPVLIGLIAAFRVRRIRLEVNEDVVRVQGSRRPDNDQVPRNEIRTIHYFPSMVSFRGPDGESFWTIGPEWTLRQMVKVAATLEVPLYDHRRSLGMRMATTGRLVYDPASGLVARRKLRQVLQRSISS